MSCTALRKYIKERKCGIFRQIFDAKSRYRELNPLCPACQEYRCFLCFVFSFSSFVFLFLCFFLLSVYQIFSGMQIFACFFTGSFIQQKRWGSPPFSVRMLTKHQLAVCCLKEHDFRLCAGYFFCAFFSFLFFEVRF